MVPPVWGLGLSGLRADLRGAVSGCAGVGPTRPPAAGRSGRRRSM